MTGILWRGSEILSAMDATLVGSSAPDATGISIDSRTIKPGELYVAIKGDIHDGHSFVGAALQSGAAGAVVSQSALPDLAGLAPLFVVPDSLQGLIALGRAARARSGAKIIAVTGSAGKTGTKDALAHILAAQGKTHYSVASFNNHWGVPLTLARMPADAAYGVFEIGMNHPGEITPLVGMVRPQVAIITTIAPVHLEFFGTTDAIADAKGEIFSGVVAGGTAIINGDIRERARLDAHARNAGIADIVHFGAGVHCQARLIRAAYHESSSDIEADILGHRLSYGIASAGEHIAMNSLAVLAACARIGADIPQAAGSFARVTPPQGRGARVRLALGRGSIELIDESYNANPASMRAALDNMGRIQPQGRRIAVLGDMLELGETAGDMHAALIDPILKNKVDLVFLSGPLMRHLWDRVPAAQRAAYAPTAQELLPLVRAALRSGDVVTVKGSLGSRMGPIVKALIQEFPPVEQ